MGALMICRALRKGALEFLPFEPLILKSFDTSNCQKHLSNNFVSIHVSFTASSQKFRVLLGMRVETEKKEAGGGGGGG